MSDEAAPPENTSPAGWVPAITGTPSVADCAASAARLLRMAEGETDRQLTSQWDDLARTWIVLGELVAETSCV